MIGISDSALKMVSIAFFRRSVSHIEISVFYVLWLLDSVKQNFES